MIKMPDLSYELALQAEYGPGFIIGVDEVGRGPLAGPVVACAVAIDPSQGWPFPEAKLINDSKKLSPNRRDYLAALIRTNLPYALGAASVTEIDRLNILQASLLAMHRAIKRLSVNPKAILIDGNRSPTLAYPSRCVVGGDAKCFTIAAASILAKVCRDHLMLLLGHRYPQFGFAEHAGYATLRHRQALDNYGPCQHHRRSFSPLSQSELALSR